MIFVKHIKCILPYNFIAADFPCPFKPSPDDKKLYIEKLTHEVRQCADGTIYSDEDCSCVVGGG